MEHRQLGRWTKVAGRELNPWRGGHAQLVGPRCYREFALPYERRLIAGLKTATSKPVSLHICGDATPILPDMAASGADILEIDHQVKLEVACRTVGREIALWGNIDPVSVLLQGTPEQVQQAGRDAIETVRACGHQRFVLSSGCTLAPETPFENLAAHINNL